MDSIESKKKSLNVLKEIAENNLKSLEVKMNNLTIKSPVDGIVTDLIIKEGQFISQTNIVMKVVNPKDIWIETKFDERISGKIKVGQTASIVLRSDKSKIYKGTVKEIEKTSDLVTLERKVNISFNEIPNDIYINEQAQINIDVETLKNVIKVPSDFITNYEEKPGVWSNNKNKTKFINVNIIGQSDNFVAVKDIDLNLKIINKGNNKISEGMRIYK